MYSAIFGFVKVKNGFFVLTLYLNGLSWHCGFLVVSIGYKLIQFYDKKYLSCPDFVLNWGSWVLEREAC